jgi:hypothetical protein
MHGYMSKPFEKEQLYIVVAGFFRYQEETYLVMRIRYC